MPFLPAGMEAFRFTDRIGDFDRTPNGVGAFNSDDLVVDIEVSSVVKARLSKVPVTVDVFFFLGVEEWLWLASSTRFLE